MPTASGLVSRRCLRKTLRSARSRRTSWATPSCSTSSLRNCRSQIVKCRLMSCPVCNLQSPDEIAYGRVPEAFRNAQLVERPRGDWAYSVSRQFLYDTADYARLESLQRSADAPLATAAGSIIREEKYHLLHAQTWLERLANGSAEARARQHAAFTALWPDALGLFEPLPGEAELRAAGIMPASSAALQAR